MYTFRNDTKVDVNRHQDLLRQSNQHYDQAIPLKTSVSKALNSLLAFAGKMMMQWGYQMQKRAGLTIEIPRPSLLTRVDS